MDEKTDRRIKWMDGWMEKQTEPNMAHDQVIRCKCIHILIIKKRVDDTAISRL